MQREYLIIIDAPASHQPTNNQIFKAVGDLVDARVKEFPKSKGGRNLIIIPQRGRRTELKQIRP